MAITTGAEYLKSATQQKKERRVKAVKKFGRKAKKIVTKGNLDVPKTVKKVTKATKKATKKVTKATKKVAKSTGARIASVASKAIKSPVGKFGPLGAAVTLAYYAGEEFFPNKAKTKTTTTKKPTAKNVPSSFGSAFKKAYKNNPGGTFTYKGKKYKAVMKKPTKPKTKTSSATIIGQGGKGRMAGGMMKKYKEGSSISFTDAAKKVKEAKDKKKFYKKYLGETDASYKARIAKKEKLANKKSRSGNIGNIDMSDFGKRKLSPGEDKIRKSDMMGGTPLGMSVDEKKKSKKYDPTKANRAGQRMGQRKAGGIMKKAVGGVIRQKRKVGFSVDETPMGKFYKPVVKYEKISKKMEREIDVLKSSMKEKGVTAEQKKELKKLIDAKKAGIKSTKQSMFSRRPSSTIPTARGSQEDVKTKKETEGYQRAKKVLKVADKRIKRKAGGIAKKYNKGGLKDVPTNKQKSLGQLPTDVRNKMGFKMSGGMAKKKMMGGGMMKYKSGTGKKGVSVQARGCGLARKKPTKLS